MAYLHCIPAISSTDSYGGETLKGIPGFARGRQNTTLAVVDLGVQSSKSTNTNQPTSTEQSSGPHAKRMAKVHNRAFHPSTPSRVQFHQRKAQTTEARANDTPKHKSQKLMSSLEGHRQEGKDRKPGSASSIVEKVYKPTLPKYCFSASTYQNMLTDYASSSSYGLVGDLSQLPRPRHTLMTRELPYVYRFKIQQGITSLNDMIPTKRMQTSQHIW